MLLILEVFGAGGYLLWIGMAAAAVGVTTFVWPTLPWEVQLSTCLLCFRSSRRCIGGDASAAAVRRSDQPLLNLRGQELIGKVFVVSEAIVDGRGKIKVADGVWIARGPDTALGERVRVIGQQGAVLLVERAE